jgi:hypothetical protein
MIELDYKNIEALKYLFGNYSREALGTMKSLAITNEHIHEFPDFNVLSIFGSVNKLCINFCKFPEFPSGLVAASLPKLLYLNLEGCNISSVKTLRPLGDLEFLRDLNLLQNPILIDRSSILKSLLFYKPIYSVSDSRKKIQRAYKQSKLILSKSKPAVVPRSPPFPMLTVLSGEIIKEDEIDTIMPKSFLNSVLPNPDPILKKVSITNKKILENKHKYDIKRPLKSSKTQRIRINSSSKLDEDIKASKNQLSDKESDSFEYIDKKTPKNPNKDLPITTEQLKEFLAANKQTRESALKGLGTKIYTFEEVSMFMYNKIVHETAQIYAVCDVLSIVNKVNKYGGINKYKTKTK